MSRFEHIVEQATLQWFQALGYGHMRGVDLAPDSATPERQTWNTVILAARFQSALHRINPHLPESALAAAARTILQPTTPDYRQNNRTFQKYLIEGIAIDVRKNGELRGERVYLIDPHNPDNNDWLVVNQLRIKQGPYQRIPDVVVYLNGLPLAVLELKNPQDESATLQTAWNQLQTYKQEFPELFHTNEVLIIADGTEARVGSLTADMERFWPWRTIEGQDLAPSHLPQLEVLIKGLFDKTRFLDYIRHFILWETEAVDTKKIAGYHQYYAVNKAITETIRAAKVTGDRKIGVIWHTQGSGKSILMLFYVAKLIRQTDMANPTIVILTDRNDLDGQLFSQFCQAPDLIPFPEQAHSRDHLQQLLQVASGGIVFTTIQKFGTQKGEIYPQLCDRHNIVVVVDEAHRSQYEFIAGFARNIREGLPNASFIGFTGTPIEFEDKSTPAVFGEYIDTYTISQAVGDKATVPIHYEARLAQLILPDPEKPKIDAAFAEVTEGEEEVHKTKLKGQWAKLEAMVGTAKRLKLLAKDITDHWHRRLEILDGKAMIVCMSRRIAVDLYQQIVTLYPNWDSDRDEAGVIKVIMTSSASDPPHYQAHIRSKPRLKAIEKRFKDPQDPLKIVIVRDMWLTGFDAPCAHTLYVDKPMQGHNLMQTIARINRVFQDKPSGLVVDYLGLGEQLKQAVSHYSRSQSERPTIPVAEALAILQEKYEVVKAMFHGLDYSGFFSTYATAQLQALSLGSDHICSQIPSQISSQNRPLRELKWKRGGAALPPQFLAESYGSDEGSDKGDNKDSETEGKKRFFDAMARLNKASAIAAHLERARPYRDDIAYFQAVQSNLRKYTTGGSGQSNPELNAAIRQIVSGALTSNQVIDIFDLAGVRKPDLSILSDQFLETVKTSPYQNLQIELLKKLLKDEIKSQFKRNVIQSRKFSEMLERTLKAYINRSLEAAEVILELIALAQEIRDSPNRTQELGLTDDELAFYDALIDHGNVREVMGDSRLANIAHDLVATIRQSVTIDWTQKEAVRADMRRKIKRLLRHHGYPPDKKAAAVVTVIEQAEQVCRDWAA